MSCYRVCFAVYYEDTGRINMTEKDISEIVKQLRIKLKLTQEQFAAKVGVTFSTVNRWENRKSKPSPLAAGKIKKMLSKKDKS